MKKKVPSILLISLFTLFLVTSVHATVSIESTIEDNVSVVCSLTGLDQTLYDAAKADPVFNGSTIAQIIVQNLKNENRTNVTHGFQLDTYDDANRAISASFLLGGADIITSTINRTSLKRNIQVQTDWRKFQVNLTSTVSIDFATYFAQSVQSWQLTDYTDSNGNAHPSYYYETGKIQQFGKMSFRFILPSAATNVQAEGDTITYDVTLGFEDILIGSPFLILAVIVIVVLIALVYRRIR
jgi:hypothetical protein